MSINARRVALTSLLVLLLALALSALPLEDPMTLNDNQPALRDIDSADRGALTPTLGYALNVNPADPERAVQPLTFGAAATFPPQALTVGAAVVVLTVPPGATHATLHVVSGGVRRSIGSAPGPTTPALNTRDSEEISGAELTAYRLVRDGAVDALVHVEFRVGG